MEEQLKDLERFQKAFNSTYNETPTLLSEEDWKLRYKLSLEELEEYKELYFSIIHDEIYHVRDDFPRIISKPNGIVDLTYKINLEKCKDYIVVDVIEKIRGKLK